MEEEEHTTPHGSAAAFQPWYEPPRPLAAAIVLQRYPTRFDDLRRYRSRLDGLGKRRL